MSRKYSSVFFILAFINFSAFSDIIIPKEASQGEVVTVYYSSSGSVMHSFSCEIVSDEKSMKSEGFLYSRYRHKDLWVCFIPVPMDFEPGEYDFRYYVNSKSDKNSDYRIIILPSEFIIEEIPLNKDMSSLDKNNTRQRQIDRRELKDLLHVYNKAAVYRSSKYDFPLIGNRFSSLFGDKRIYKYSDGTVSRSRHHGIDIAAPTGSIIKAGATGKVVMARDRVISGKTIVIENYPGVYSLYYHLDKIFVRQGQVVSPDSLIGTVGSTGLVTGPHLHWQIVVNNIAVNPEKLVAGLLIDKDKINSIID